MPIWEADALTLVARFVNIAAGVRRFSCRVTENAVDAA
jgi:hypothetical protein